MPPPLLPPPLQDDFAIVVGLSDYPSPSMPSLRGPQHDAQNIAAWLLDPSGGRLPSENLTKILSADFEPPPGSPTLDPLDARPSQHEIDRAFRALRNRIQQNYVSVGRQARRLYVFMAGHGLSRDPESAALLTADGDYDANINYCIDPKVYVQWFVLEGYFKEVVVWMDCCRDSHPNVVMPQFLWPTSPLPDPISQQARFFYGFAARGNAQSRELPLPPPDGQTQGLFTYALLEGLQNAPADAEGKVTDAGLAGYVYRVLQREAKPGKSVQEPYMPTDTLHPVVIVERAPLTPAPLAPENPAAAPPLPALSNRYKVGFAPPPLPEGTTVEAFDNDLQSLGSFAANQSFTLQNVPVGLCGLRRSDGKTGGFSVLKTDEVAQITFNWETGEAVYDRW